MTSVHRILIVEDEVLIAKDLSFIVEDMGHEVVGIADNAEDAVYLMKLHAPDLVLSDIVIKGQTDGITLGRMIREEFETALIFLTSHADKTTIARASAIKPNGYIVKPFTPPAIEAAIATAIANYVSEHSKVDLQTLDASRSSGLSAQCIEHIDDYLDHNFDKDINLQALAELTNVPGSSFSKRFKTATGKSPYQYVIERRIEEAKRLLRHTESSIAEISLTVGYANQAHFSTAFRKVTGVTPGAYRKL
ncbi:MAG: response regulator transcription factor [Pseudomonadota bacterium]